MSIKYIGLQGRYVRNNFLAFFSGFDIGGVGDIVGIAIDIFHFLLNGILITTFVPCPFFDVIRALPPSRWALSRMLYSPIRFSRTVSRIFLFRDEKLQR